MFIYHHISYVVCTLQATPPGAQETWRAGLESVLQIPIGAGRPLCPLRLTEFGSLLGSRVRLSCGRLWVCYQPWSRQQTSLRWYKLPPCFVCRHYCRSLVVQLEGKTGRVLCGTVYGDLYYKDLLRSIVRKGYCIPVPNFYIVLHSLRCWKGTPKCSTAKKEKEKNGRVASERAGGIMPYTHWKRKIYAVQIAALSVCIEQYNYYYNTC